MTYDKIPANQLTTQVLICIQLLPLDLAQQIFAKSSLFVYDEYDLYAPLLHTLHTGHTAGASRSRNSFSLFILRDMDPAVAPVTSSQELQG